MRTLPGTPMKRNHEGTTRLANDVVIEEITQASIERNRRFFDFREGKPILKTSYNGAAITIGPPLTDYVVSNIESLEAKIKSKIASKAVLYFHPLEDLHITLFTVQTPVEGILQQEVIKAGKDIPNLLSRFSPFRLRLIGLKLINGSALVITAEDKSGAVREMRSRLKAHFTFAPSIQNDLIHITLARFLTEPERRENAVLSRMLHDHSNARFGVMEVSVVKYVFLKTRYLEFRQSEQPVFLKGKGS